MATYTLYGTVGGRVYSTNATYATARSGGTLATDDVGNNGCTIGQLLYSGTHYIYEAYTQFDTSSVLGTVSSATLSMGYRLRGGDTNAFYVYARAYDWGASLTTADWVAGASLSANALRATSALSSAFSGVGYSDFTSDGSFVSNTTNPVRLILSSSRTESGTAPTTDGIGFPAYDERIYFDSPTGTNPPKLTIVTDYVPPAGSFSRRRPSGLYTR